MEERYNIYFAGQVVDGFALHSVRENMARVFNADAATLEKLFCGKPQLIKRNCDKTTALKYKQALERAGAIPVIKRVEAQAAEKPMTAAEKIAALASAPDQTGYRSESAKPPSPTNSQQVPAAQTGGIALAPPGTEVLREHERAEPIVREVDTSGLTAETAERLSAEAPPPPAAPDTAHLSMANVGDSIPNLQSSAVPVSPNLEGLALSAPGTDFSDCAAPEPSELSLDLSHLAALPPGDAPQQERQQRRSTEVAAPSTDHISLED